MKNRSLLFSISFLPLVAFFIVLGTGDHGKRTYVPRGTEPGQTIGGAAEYWKTIRNNQLTGEVALADIEQALAEIKQLRGSKSLSWAWDEMGPDNQGGRTRAILFDKTTPTTMYAGAVSGGLWKSTTSGSSWVKVATIAENMIVASIAQAPNGDIYVGTGEGFYPGTGDGTRGFNGMGIYKSEDGDNFTLLTNTSGFSYVNELAVAPNGYVYAATKSGLKISSDAGASWSVIPTYSPSSSNTNGDDVNIASDGTVVVVLNNHCYVSANGTDFTRVSGASPYTLPAAGERMEIAIAPTDPNYLYASLAAANGSTQGIYRSVDKGANWTQIGPSASTTFNIHNNQGDYDNAIAVFPNDKNKIIVGGINLWTWSEGGTWTQITSGSFSMTSPLYVHVDIHELAFHPTNPNLLFVGCDGGIHRSTDGGATWSMMNKNYCTLQYYAITSSGSGQVMGGTQDNSYHFIDFKGNTTKSSRELWAGDGGYAAISQLNPEAYFVSSQFGSAARTANDFQTYQKAYKGSVNTDAEFFSRRMLLEGTPGTNFSNFVTPLALWETIHAFDSKDSVMFLADTNYLAGEVVRVRSHAHNGYPFSHTLLAGINKGDSMLVQNPIQSMFVIAARTALWMTRQALDFSGTPQWFKIGSTTGGIVQTFTISADGNYIFVGTTAGNVFRYSNIRQAYDSLSADVTSSSTVITRTTIGSWSGRAVTSIAVDPLDHNNVVVTLGNYGNTAYVYRSTNALDATPTFTSKQGTAVSTKLPAMPVYSSVIPIYKPNMLIVGTEYGTYICEDINQTQPVWAESNVGMDRVPTLMLHQQVTAFPYDYIITGSGNETALFEYAQTTNFKGIYAGTHGRGAFRNLDFVTGIENPTSQKPSAFKSQILVYPNPVVSEATAVINFSVASRANVRVFDLSGKVVLSIDGLKMNAGRNEIKLDMSGLMRGNYIVQVISGAESKTAKIIRK